MMSPAAQPWLPDSAVKSREARDAIEGCVAQWAGDWIAEGKIAVDQNWQDGALRAGFVECENAAGICLTYRPDPNYRLASMLLKQDLGPKDVRTEQDRQLIDQLARKALGDLHRRVGQALGQNAGPARPAGNDRPRGNDRPAAEIVLRTGEDDALIVIAIDPAVLIDFAMGKACRPRGFPPPHPRAEAIAGQSVCMAALVGRTTLQLAELKEIGVGDVLVLDRPVAQSLDIMIENRPCGPESASLSLDDNRLTLAIERTANQW